MTEINLMDCFAIKVMLDLLGFNINIFIYLMKIISLLKY